MPAETVMQTGHTPGRPDSDALTVGAMPIGGMTSGDLTSGAPVLTRPPLDRAQADQAPAVIAQPARLKRRAQFLRAAAGGRKAAVGGVVVQALTRDDDGPARLGFTVTKKVGNAVVRNRTRRRLKEAARLLLRELPVHGVDLVMIGRDSTRKRKFTALQADLRKALDRTGALDRSGTPRQAGLV